jgi:hypothetical protein
MIVVEPELVWTVPDITSGCKFKPFHHPVPPAFRRGLNDFQDGRCGVSFKVPYNSRQILLFCTKDTMEMVAHDCICPDLQAFVCPAIRKAIQQNVPVYFPGKYIDPIHYSKGEEVEATRVIDFIACCHAGVNIGAA